MVWYVCNTLFTYVYQTWLFLQLLKASFQYKPPMCLCTCSRPTKGPQKSCHLILKFTQVPSISQKQNKNVTFTTVTNHNLYPLDMKSLVLAILKFSTTYFCDEMKCLAAKWCLKWLKSAGQPSPQLVRAITAAGEKASINYNKVFFEGATPVNGYRIWF